IRLPRGRKAWLVLTAAGVVVAGVVGVTRWLTREAPVPEIPRPDPSAFTDREVLMDVFGAARRVELEPRSAAAWGGYGIVLRACGRPTRRPPSSRTRPAPPGPAWRRPARRRRPGTTGPPPSSSATWPTTRSPPGRPCCCGPRSVAGRAARLTPSTWPPGRRP